MWVHKNTVLQVGERYVVCYSKKLDKVLTTGNYTKAKRFKPFDAQEFIRLYKNKDGFLLKDLLVWTFKPGQKFNPKGELQ